MKTSSKLLSTSLLVLTTMLCAASAFDPDSVEQRAAKPDYEGSDIVRFTKYMYSVLGDKSAEELARDFKEDYDALNTDGKLGVTLSALYEMRMEDLLVSVRHSKKMREVIDILETL